MLDISGELQEIFEIVSTARIITERGRRGVSCQLPRCGKDIRKYAVAGDWNYPHMLEVGNGMSVNEDRAHFSLWCMMAAPLIAGNDLRAMSKETNEILTNREVLGVDQDSLGVQGYRYSTQDSIEVWVKPLMHGDWAVALPNRSGKYPKN